jgi:hypothetical protein
MADRVDKVPGRKPEVAARAAGRFESCAIRSGKVKSLGRPPIRNRVGGQPLGIRASAFRLMATTQLVDGAALIKRYSAVRFRGGQLLAAHDAPLEEADQLT